MNVDGKQTLIYQQLDKIAKLKLLEREAIKHAELITINEGNQLDEEALRNYRSFSNHANCLREELLKELMNKLYFMVQFTSSGVEHNEDIRLWVEAWHKTPGTVSKAIECRENDS